MVFGLAQAQRKAGHQVWIAIKDRSCGDRVPENLREDLPESEGIPIVNHPGTAISPLAFQGMKADVVHLHGIWCPHVAALAGAARKENIPYLLAPHGSLGQWSMKQKALKKALAYRLYFRRILEGAALVHVNSAREGDDLRRLGFHGTLLHLPHGVSPASPASPDATSVTLARLRIPQGRRFVLFLGRLAKVKSLPMLIEAFARIAPGLADVDLVIAGPDEGELPAIHRKVSSCAESLQQRIHLPGPVHGEDKEHLLAACSTLCLPSEYESFGIVLLEAMRHGKPIVFTKGCGLSSEDIGAAGVLAEHTAASLGQALERCLSEAGSRMGQRGKEIVQERYQWADIAFRLNRSYLEALNRV